MSYVGRSFTSMAPDESQILAFDFVNDLPTGDAINAVQPWNITVMSGIDAAPQTHAIGPAFPSGTLSEQRVAGLLANVTYALEAVISTIQGNTLSLWAAITCLNPGTYPTGLQDGG